MDRRVAAKLVAGTLMAARWVKAAPLVAGVRFSFMLWALEKQGTFDQRLEMVAAAGYQGVELVGEFQKWAPGERLRVLQKLKTLGLVVDSMSGVKAGFAVAADGAAFLTQLQEHLEYAKLFECPQVILLSGNRVDGETAEAQHRTSVENLKRAAELAAKQKIEIVIEPIDLLENPKIFMASVTEGFAIAETVAAPNVRVLYDLYHEQRSFGNLLEKLEKNIDRVGLIHVADVPGRHEPGTGEVDYAMIYRRLRELKYSRWIAMEYYPTSEPVASLKKARLDAGAILNG